MKHDQLPIVESEVSAKVKEKRLNRRSRMAQDILSLAGGGFTDSFYNSGTSNGPADFPKWSYCHSNEHNTEAINDFVSSIDLNDFERHCSNLLDGNNFMQAMTLLSNLMSYLYVCKERRKSCVDPNSCYINRGIFLLEIDNVLNDRTDYHAKVINIVDSKRSVAKYTRVLKFSWGNEWNEADSKQKCVNRIQEISNVSNIAARSRFPHQVFSDYGWSADHSTPEVFSNDLEPSAGSTNVLRTSKADMRSQQESEVKTQQDERLAPKKIDGVFEIKNRAGNVGATSNSITPETPLRV